MISHVSQPRLKGFRFPRSIISYAVWACHRFAQNLSDVEHLLAERRVIVSYKSIRAWCQRFGTQIAARIRRDRPAPADKWHLDEVVISIRGWKHWLWRAIDVNGDVLEILVQSRRNAYAAKRVLTKLMRRWGLPRAVVPPLVTLLRNALPGSGQAAQLRRGNPGPLPKGRSPLAKGVEQPFRGVASTHTTKRVYSHGLQTNHCRAMHGPFQITASGAVVLIRPRPYRHHLSAAFYRHA